MKTIILFEDEQAISNVFRVSFERMGYTVLQAATFKEATKIAAEYVPPIDLLIADMIVRVSICIRVATALASTHPQMAVLFISGLPPEVLTHSGLMKNSEILTFPRIEFLQKPFLPWILEEHVRELIGVS
jgi:two-component system cell cycle sensor histidine kinase/response regulator CckA